MGWKRRKPLWPFVGALTILLLLAVDAPRKWRSESDGLASAQADRLPGPGQWYHMLYPPQDLPALPDTSPVEAPQLPRLEKPQLPYPVKAKSETRVPSAAGLPLRREFSLDTLLEIRDSLGDLIGQLPELPAPGQGRNSTAAPTANRVTVTSPEDRLAMRGAFRNVGRGTLPPPTDTQRRLETFADELMETVRRSRQGLKPPVRVARRDPESEIIAEPAFQTKTEPTHSVSLPEHKPVAEESVVEAPFVEAPVLDAPQAAIPEATPVPTTREAEESPNIASDEPPFEVMPVTPAVEPSREDMAMASPEPEVVEPELTKVEVKQPEVVTPPALPLLRFRPQALIDRLERVSPDSPAAEWSAQTLQQVRKLACDPGTPRVAAPEILSGLQLQVSAGKSQAEQVADHALRQHWLRLVQALDCRLDVWRYLFDSNLNASSAHMQLPEPNEAQTLEALNEIATLLEGDVNGDPWREYLLLDQVAAATSSGADVRSRRRLAHEVLSRLEDPRLTDAQQKFVKTPPVNRLQQCLLPWALGPVDIETLAALIERYDARPDVRYAAALRQFKQRLQWSAVDEHQQLAQHLDEHYRGANMRVAFSEQLFSRLLPKQSAKLEPVNDKFAGAPVKGRSRTTVRLNTEMIPNEEAWQISLQAKGAVYSKTRSDTWPAKVKNSAKMFYDARKTILIDGQGMRLSPTRATVKGRNELVGVDSEFDPIPILGSLVREGARRKHQQSHGLALRQAKAKVARKAKSQMDNDAGRKLQDLERKFSENILTSLEKLALVAEPVEMYTTAERAVMRMRLANSLQLAASSLRPLAPSDSLASMQLHESVLNNAIAGLQLEERCLTALQLHHFITARLGRPGELPPADLPAKAKIKFASYDAVRFNCQGDRLEVVLNIEEVSHGRDKIGSFAVHAFFRPEVNGLEVQLVREGTLQFEGRRLRMGSRCLLHSVFNKLIRKDQVVQLVKHDVSDDPRLKGLMVTQLVIDDGWIGLALGPEYTGRTAWRTLPHVIR